MTTTIDYENRPPTPEEFHEFRANARLSKTQAAELLHVHRNTITNWESGEVPVSLAHWELFRFKLQPLLGLAEAVSKVINTER